MSNISYKNRNPCLVLFFKGNAFNILSLGMTLAIGFLIDVLYQIEEVPSNLFWQKDIHKDIDIRKSMKLLK